MEKDLVIRQHIISDYIKTRLNVVLFYKVLLCVLLLAGANLLVFGAEDLTTVGLILIWGLYGVAHLAILALAVQGIRYLVNLVCLYRGNYRVETDHIKNKWIVRNRKAPNTYHIDFRRFGNVPLQEYDYYKWSDYHTHLSGVYEQAEIGEAYYLVVVGKKTVVMFYPARHFEMAVK